MVKVALLVALSLVPGLAFADDSGRSEYQTGTRYFEAEEFDVALPYFQRAYDHSGKRPATVFALAQCERALKLYPEAIAHFEEYLASAPENQADVTETVRLLKEVVAKSQATADEQERAAHAQRQAAAEEAARQAATDRALIEERQKRVAAEQDAEAERQKRQIAEETQKREAAEREAAERSQRQHAARQATASPLVAAPPPAAESSLVESPVFWIVTGALAIGGAVTAGVLLSQGSDGYAGTSHLILRP